MFTYDTFAFHYLIICYNLTFVMHILIFMLWI